MRRIYTFMLALILCLVLAPQTYALGVTGSGSCGENATWTLTDDGTLTISGQGPMEDYTSSSLAPWLKLKDTTKVKTVIIENGITHIGDRSFYFMWHSNPYLTSVEIPSSVQTIGKFAFGSCDGLTNVVIPEGVTSIGEQAFIYCRYLTSLSLPSTLTSVGDAAFACENLENVYYAGSAKQWENIVFEKNNHFLLMSTIHYGDTAVNEDRPSDWARDEVIAAIASHLVPESEQKNYKQPITRGKVTAIIVRLLEESYGKPISDILVDKNVTVNPQAFTDTDDPNVFAANALGIINGIGNNQFYPDGTLTRAQIAALVNRVANVVGVNTSGYTHNFTDVVGHWSSPELGWPSQTGILKGVGNNLFNPNGPLTTEQAIVTAYRALQVLKNR